MNFSIGEIDRAAFKAVIKNAEKNKNGVIVDGELDFGIIEQNEVAKSLQRVVRIQPEAPSTKILFASVKLNMNSAPSSRRVTPP
jgi:helicase MOV-10